MKTISIVIPALNEEKTIGFVVKEFVNHERVYEVIVVDNNSIDMTSHVALNAGAKVISCKTPGAGAAVRKGMREAKCDWVFKCDGDIRNPDKRWIDILASEIGDGVGLIKGNWCSPEDDLPVTNLVVKPGLKLFFPDLEYVEMPITGLYLVNVNSVIIDHLSNDYSFDLQLAIQVHLRGNDIRQVYLGELYHRNKSSAEYTGMAVELLSYLVNFHGRMCGDGLTIVAPTILDAFLWTGGTQLKYLLAGAKVSVLVLEESAEYDPIADYLMGFSRFCILQDMRGNAKKAVRWSYENRADDLLIVPPECEKFIPIELRGAGAPRKHGVYLYTNHVAGGISFGERQNRYIDISDVLRVKRKILSSGDYVDMEEKKRISILADELSGLRCGTHFAEVYNEYAPSQVPRPFGHL